MVLSVSNLVYRRAAKLPPVLDCINLVLGAGDIFCLLGPNGSGKTTLLRCLIGALRFEHGTVRINGAVPAGARQLARTLAYVPQASGDSALSLLDTVLMGRTPHLSPLALPGLRDRLIAHAALGRVGIGHLAQQPFNRSSGGERQLTLIARALAQQPRILLMDEPTASLDLGNQARMLRMIAALAEAGMAVLFTTHQPEHALLLGARVAILAKGRIAATGPAAAVLNAESLSSLYGTAIHMLTLEGVPMACVPHL